MKRFFKTAEAVTTENGFSVLLDGRPIKTPAKADLVLPTEALAQAIAKEWDAQVEDIDPAAMPLMKFAATAIDRVIPQREKVIDDMAAFGGTDLVCYRANYPERLIKKQSDAWDPLVKWVADTHGVALTVTIGVGYVAQDETGQARLRDVLNGESDLRLAALHDVVSLTGSLVMALAVLAGNLNAEEAFEMSEIDETYAIEEWGENEEATTRRKNNRNSLIAAVEFLNLCDQ
jgi:chaperone required for assembly of F1-ATPase